MNVAIVIGQIPHYRLPFYIRLGSRDGINLSVIHSGRPVDTGTLTFTEHVIDRKNWSKIYYHPKLREWINNADVIVPLFNLRWLSNDLLVWQRGERKLVWWGIGTGSSALLNRLRVWMVRKSDGLIVYMPKAKQWYLERGIDEEKIFVAPNTVHVEQKEVVIDASRRRAFLVVGTLDARKQLGDLICAFGKIASEIASDIRVEIVGEGEELERLRKLALQHRVSARVHFRGKITDNSELESLFSSALAVVSPGQAGLSVLHSFAFGVPFVTKASAISGGEIENIENGVNGVLYDGNCEKLAVILKEFASRPEYSAELGRRAHAHYRSSRTIDHMVNGFVRALRIASQ